MLLITLGGLAAGLVATSQRETSHRYVQSLAFSPDGRLVAAGYPTGNVRLWDPSHPNSRPIELSLNDWSGTRIFSGPLAFSGPAELAFLSYDSNSGAPEIVLWDIATNREVRTIALPAYPVQLATSAKAQLAVTGTPAGNSIDVWSLKSGRQVGTLTPAKPVAGRQMMGCAISSDGTRVVGHYLTVGSDAEFLVWDLDHHQVPVPDSKADLGTISSSKSIRQSDALHCYALALSSDGEVMAVLIAAGGASVWDLNTGVKRANIKGGTFWGSLQLSPDGELLALGVYPRSFEVRHASTGEIRAELEKRGLET